MLTKVIFTFGVLCVAAQRVRELRKSKRHERALMASGGVEHAPEHFRAMRLLHASWLFAQCLEVWALRRPFVPLLAVPASALFVAGQALRLAAMRALGERWTVRIVTLPGRPRVISGPYRHFKHPNYVGVALEIAALPLVHGAYVTAALYSVANAGVLFVRILHEERALQAASP